MACKSEFLSQRNVCAIYQCFDGHLHFRYRTLDIIMDTEDFYQVAEVFTEALRILQKAKEPVIEEIDLKKMDVSIKV